MKLKVSLMNYIEKGFFMKRIKHFKDTKANNHWQRWMRSRKNKTKNCYLSIAAGFNQSDYNIDGKLKKQKIIKELLEKECLKEN